MIMMLKFSVIEEENTKLQEIKIQSNPSSKKTRSSVIIIWTFRWFFYDDYDAKIFCYFGRKHRVPKTPSSGIQGYGFRFWWLNIRKKSTIG